MALADPERKVRTAVSMAISAIAEFDFPQDWPGLLEVLVGVIKDKSNPNLGGYCLNVC
jgi:hypothetical protein